MTDSNSPWSRPAEPDPVGLWQGALDQARTDSAAPAGLPTPATLQAAFPELRIVGLIGRGGMGAVYRAHDARLDRDVAIKVLPPALAADPAFAERFAREARALARLQHPHVLAVHDFGQRGDLHYLLTEFVDGVDLRRLMSMGRLPPEEALRIVPQVCAALQFAHDHGIVHRDIKPENVLIDTQGNVRVADFGLARILGESHGAPSLTATSQLLGTPHYMAPEQLRGAAVDHRADIFALSVMLYEMLTGQLPIGHFTPPSKRAGTAPRLDDIVMRALAEEPERRYQHASEVSRDLRDETPRSGAPAVDRARVSRSGRRLHRDPHRHPTRGLRVAWLVVIAGVIAVATLLSANLRDQNHARLQRERAVAGLQSDAESGAAADARPETPPAPTVSPSFAVSEPAPAFALGRSVVAIAALALVLLLTTSGFRALRRLREAGIADGAGFATFTAWAPILLALDALVLVPLQQLRDQDTRQLATAVGLAICLLADTLFLAWRIRDLRRAVAA
ncbi:MAG: serine/threonine protein kinase [Planctomycetes bacterium]|nr:serine/threonine protein kinase [Planctomycetota bacterium]